MEYQPRVTDLIPKRPWTLLVLVLSALLAVSVVQALYAHMHLGHRWVGSENLQALDPTQTGSLAGWLSSSLLGLAAILSVAIYSIRRHRLDDYKGRYRVWLTCAVLCLLASIDATTALHRVPRSLFVQATARLGGETWTASGGFWWTVLVLALLGVSGIRLGIEARRSVGALAWVLASLLAYAFAGAISLGYIALDEPLVAELVKSSARLGGDLAMFCALFTYARYVYLDAQGILAQRRAAREAARRKRRAEKAARAEAKAQAKAERLAAKETARAERLAAKQSAKASSDSDDEDDEESTAARKTSDKSSAAPREASSTTGPTTSPRVESKGPLTVKPNSLTKPASPPLDDDDDADDADEDDASGLSRAERRRLKKLARREGRRAA